SVELYLSLLKEQGYSVSHCTHVKSVINHFCQWLIEDKEVLRRNPTRDVEIKVQQQLAPRILSPDQRFVLRTLIEKEGDLRGKAIFALGYWAGCRVSDIAHLRMEHAHIGPKMGWVHVGHKGGSSVILICSMKPAALSMTIFATVVVTPKARMSLPPKGTRS